MKNILFVGCEWYTKSYEKLFSEKNHMTIEIDPDLKKYGAKKHFTDSIENIENHTRARVIRLHHLQWCI